MAIQPRSANRGEDQFPDTSGTWVEGIGVGGTKSDSESDSTATGSGRDFIAKGNVSSTNWTCLEL